MSNLWPKIFRDPVHDIIPFEDTPDDRLLLDLINTSEFQRLRRIKQLGFTEFVFPGANHSRFAHSLGVMQLARLILERIQRLGIEVSAPHVTLVLVAALLHDVGHGPFSHAFENVTSDNHERRTLEIILSGQTEINKVLTASEEALPEKLRAFFSSDFESSLDEDALPLFLTQVVSSQLDADRFDYLLRDSHATGTDYGRFDLKWLVEHLHLDMRKKRFYLSSKAQIAAEQYVFARYHMYRTVYFHKTTRAAEVMFKLALKRYKELLAQASSAEAKREVVSNAPHAVVSAFSGAIPLPQYLSLDDHSVTEFLKACAFCPDTILNSLATDLLHRRLFKATDVSNVTADKVANFTEKAKEVIAAKGFDVNYFFATDTPGDTPYKGYDPDAEEPVTQIYIEAPGGMKELSILSYTVGALKKGYRLLRYYYPPQFRAEIDQISQENLR